MTRTSTQALIQLAVRLCVLLRRIFSQRRYFHVKSVRSISLSASYYGRQQLGGLAESKKRLLVAILRPRIDANPTSSSSEVREEKKELNNSPSLAPAQPLCEPIVDKDFCEGSSRVDVHSGASKAGLAASTPTIPS